MIPGFRQQKKMDCFIVAIDYNVGEVSLNGLLMCY